MKYLILANNSDGLYGFRKELLYALSQTGTLYVSVPNNGYFQELKQIGCRILETKIDRRGVNPFIDLHLCQQYLKIVKEINPDLVITYTIKPNIYGGLVCLLTKKRYAMNITGLGTAFQGSKHLRWFAELLYKISASQVETVFFENAMNLQTFIDLKIISKNKCCLLSGAGVNLTQFSALPYPVQNSPIHFLFVGRLMKEKGINELFTAFLKLKATFCCTVILDIVGRIEDSYLAQFESLQKDGTIVFHGYQQNMLPYYEAAHCIVLPSYHEGMSNVLLEGAACARPLITTRIPGCMEAIEENKSGFLCKAKDTESLYDAMKRFIELPYEEKKQFGLEGRKRMEKLFDKKKVVKATLERLSL